MKKVLSLFNIIAVMGFCAMFSSCNEDADITRSILISGEWKGHFGMFYEIDDPYGNTVRFDSYDTRIKFIPAYDYATYGEGYQVDWYPVGPYEELSFHFYWNIDNGIIHLDYPGYREDYNADIYNYSLNNDEFTGYFHIGGEEFRLFKLKDYYWEPYYAYDYYPWERASFAWDIYYGYSYSRALKTDEAPADSVKADSARIIRIGNRFAEQK